MVAICHPQWQDVVEAWAKIRALEGRLQALSLFHIGKWHANRHGGPTTRESIRSNGTFKRTCFDTTLMVRVEVRNKTDKLFHVEKSFHTARMMMMMMKGTNAVDSFK
jgi:hypothetical protein